MRFKKTQLTYENVAQTNEHNVACIIPKSQFDEVNHTIIKRLKRNEHEKAASRKAAAGFIVR